jgi:hypothetical protein
LNSSHILSIQHNSTVFLWLGILGEDYTWGPF